MQTGREMYSFSPLASKGLVSYLESFSCWSPAGTLDNLNEDFLSFSVPPRNYPRYDLMYATTLPSLVLQIYHTILPRVGLTNLPPSVSWLSRQCEILNISQPYRPPRPVMRITLLYGEGVCFLWGTNWTVSTATSSQYLAINCEPIV
jgi:hypothetical protein